MADVGVFSRYKGFADFQGEAQKQGLAQALTMAQIQKAQQLDVGALGEQAFMKAAMGAPLTPQEAAAFQYVDAKSGGIMFDPSTGAVTQKPRLSERLGASRITPTAPLSPQTNGDGRIPSNMQKFLEPSSSGTPASATGTDYLTEITQQPSGNEWDADYQKQRADMAARGDRKGVHDLDVAYAKSKIEMNADQSRNAGFADRMASSNPIIQDTTKAATNLVEVKKSKIPLLGNFIVNDDFQSFNQAQRDFINAQLRRESGAVISPEEFRNAGQQYFPQPGDSETVLAQKADNRDNALRAMKRSAGPAYKPQPINKRRAAFEEGKAPKENIGGLTPDEQTELEALRARFKK